MKKMLLVAFLCLVPALYAQAHSITLNWTASTDAVANPTLTYNIYRLNNICPATVTLSQFTKLAGVAAGVLTYQDTTVTVGNAYCYVATSVLNSQESGPSNSAGAVILPAAPSNLVIGNIQ